MRIIARSEWGARPATGRANFFARDRIVAHWWASPNWRWVETHGGPAAAMRHVQRLHQRRGGWDIYYNFCIAQTGEIFEGRGFNNRGGAQGVPSSDHKDLSAAFMVGPVGVWPGPTEAPSDEAVVAFAWLIHEARRRGWDGKIIGHNDTKPKACPGPELEALVDAWVDGPPDENGDDDMGWVDKIDTAAWVAMGRLFPEDRSFVAYYQPGGTVERNPDPTAERFNAYLRWVERVTANALGDGGSHDHPFAAADHRHGLDLGDATGPVI